MNIEALNHARLGLLYPPLIGKANLFIADCEACGVKILITQGLRTFAEQNALYAEGRSAPGKIVTNAKGGQSYHNFGLAFDIVPIDANGNPIWDTSNEAWTTAKEIGDLHPGSPDTRIDPQRMAEIISQELGLSLGADWTKFKDIPHYELTGGVPLQVLRNLYKSNDLSACWQEVDTRLH